MWGKGFSVFNAEVVEGEVSENGRVKTSKSLLHKSKENIDKSCQNQLPENSEALQSIYF